MSNRIVGIVLFAFLLFITMKGDLRGYLQVVGLVPGDTPSVAKIPDISKGGGGVTDALKSAAQVAAVAGG